MNPYLNNLLSQNFLPKFCAYSWIIFCVSKSLSSLNFFINFLYRLTEAGMFGSVSVSNDFNLYLYRIYSLLKKVNLSSKINLLIQE
jgi:hypothetical protein